MKNISKNSKGITLIALITTIIVLLILASVATYNGISIINQSKLTKFTTEMKIMQTEVNQLYQRYSDGDTIQVGNETYTGEAILSMRKDSTDSDYSTDIENPSLPCYSQVQKVFTSEQSGITDKTGYLYFNEKLIEDLNIEGVEQEFFVNISTRSVVSYEGLKYDDTMYYTLEQLPNSLYNVEYNDKNIGQPIIEEASIEQVSNDKWRITISGIEYDGYVEKWQVKYQLEKSDYWNTSEDLSFIVNENGNYKVKVTNGSIESEEVTIEKCAVRAGISVGDYIDYTPGGGTYDITKLTTYSGSSENGTENLTLDNMGSLDWQVLRIYDDGSIDLIGSPTNKTIYFYGSKGYNNGVYLMNDICKTLYSRGGIEARSVNIEDMESWLTDDILNDDETVNAKGGKTIKNEYKSDQINDLILDETYTESKDTDKNTVTYTTARPYYPNIYQYQIGAGIDTEDVNTIGISESDSYYSGYDSTKENALIATDEEGVSYDKADNIGLTITQTYYSMEINEQYYGEGSKPLKNKAVIWIASRYSNCYSSFIRFGLNCAGKKIIGESMLSSACSSYGGAYALRPVVSLEPNVQIEATEGTTSTTNMHHIIKY